MDHNYQKELQAAFDDFLAKVNEAKKVYNQKMDDILKEIDELKIAKIKKNLNI